MAQGSKGTIRPHRLHRFLLNYLFFKCHNVLCNFEENRNWNWKRTETERGLKKLNVMFCCQYEQVKQNPLENSFATTSLSRPESTVWTNQRPELRWRDLSRPIRGQYSPGWCTGHMSRGQEAWHTSSLGPTAPHQPSTLSPRPCQSEINFLRGFN